MESFFFVRDLMILGSGNVLYFVTVFPNGKGSNRSKSDQKEIVPNGIVQAKRKDYSYWYCSE